MRTFFFAGFVQNVVKFPIILDETQVKIFRLADQISNLCKSWARLKAGIEFAQKGYTVAVVVLAYGNFFCGFRSKMWNLLSILDVSVFRLADHLDENSSFEDGFGNFFLRGFVWPGWSNLKSLQKWARLKAGIEFTKDTLLRLVFSPMVTFFCGDSFKNVVKFPIILDENSSEDLSISWSNLKSLQSELVWKPASSLLRIHCCGWCSRLW